LLSTRIAGSIWAAVSSEYYTTASINVTPLNSGQTTVTVRKPRLGRIDQQQAGRRHAWLHSATGGAVCTSVRPLLVATSAPWRATDGDCECQAHTCCIRPTSRAIDRPSPLLGLFRQTPTTELRRSRLVAPSRVWEAGGRSEELAT